MEGSFGFGNAGDTPLGRRRGPYGTNLGDIWLGDDSEVGRRLKEQDGLTLIHEVMDKDGKVQDCIYSTRDKEIIDMATRGHELWIAEQASRN